MAHGIKMNLDNSVIAINKNYNVGRGGGRQRDRRGDQRRERFRKNVGRHTHDDEIRHGRRGTSTQKNDDSIWTRHVFPSPHAAQTIAQSNMETKLILSNVNFEITDMDILLIFAQFGDIRKAAVHYDKLGRSLGTAVVIFENRNDAINAMREYNGVLLDGRILNIQVMTSEIPNPIEANIASKAFHNKRPLNGNRRTKETKDRIGETKFHNRQPFQDKSRSTKETRIRIGQNKFHNKQPLQGRNRSTQERPAPARRVSGNDGKFKNKSHFVRKGQSNKGHGGHNLKNKKKKASTAEELDAELDAYFKEMLTEK